MNDSTHKIELSKGIDKSTWDKIDLFCKNKSIVNIKTIISWISLEFNIDITVDPDIVKGYLQDWSNIKGSAIGLCRPKNDVEATIIIRVFYLTKIQYTISAGKTNLTGSATPLDGFVLSVENLKHVQPIVCNDKVNVSAGIYLEDMRNQVLSQSNNKYFYPVDPTSRREAMVGGTLSCNASGFIPGDMGATRYWVNALTFILPNGYSIKCERGQYISYKSHFILNNNKLTIPNYNRPKIKNASGPYTCDVSEIDFIDFIIGSEGIFGLITDCTLQLKERSKYYLDLFILLDSESTAINLHQFLINKLDSGLSQVSALEYFGYNCQNYMINRDKFFKNKNQVAVYIQIPIYSGTIEEACEKWLNILLDSNCKISNEDIYVLNDKKSWDLFFEARHSMPEIALKKTKELDGISIITDTIVPACNFKLFLDKAHALIQKANIEYVLFGHLGDCHLHFHLIPSKIQKKIALAIYQKIIKISAELGGVYSAEHGTGKRKKIDFIDCYGMDAENQVRDSKLCLDPDMLVNRGNIIDYKC